MDYATFGSTANFAKAAGADIGTTIVVAAGSAAAVSLGAPVIAVSILGGVVVYFVNKECINPWKNSFETEE